jgi:hypothetical protein
LKSHCRRLISLLVAEREFHGTERRIHDSGFVETGDFSGSPLETVANRLSE